MSIKVLPSKVKLLNWGENKTTVGPVFVDDETARVFSANQRAIGRERVPVDFEHNTVPGTPEYNRSYEPRPIAGHSALVCMAGKGIFAEGITWTDTGLALAANYEDVSLAPMLDKEKRVVAAHSWALTHAGAAPGMTFALAALSACGRFRTLNADGAEVVDLAALFNAMQKEAARTPDNLVSLSASRGQFRLPDGSVDFRALMREESRRNGMLRP